MEYFTIEDIKEISALSLADAEDLLVVVNSRIQTLGECVNDSSAYNKRNIELAYLEDKKYFLEKRITDILDKQLEDYHKQPITWNKRDSCDKMRKILDATLVTIPLYNLLQILNYSLASIPKNLRINVFFDFAAMMEDDGYVTRTQSYNDITKIMGGYYDEELL